MLFVYFYLNQAKSVFPFEGSSLLPGASPFYTHFRSIQNKHTLWVWGWRVGERVVKVVGGGGGIGSVGRKIWRKLQEVFKGNSQVNLAKSFYHWQNEMLKPKERCWEVGVVRWKKEELGMSKRRCSLEFNLCETLSLSVWVGWMDGWTQMDAEKSTFLLFECFFIICHSLKTSVGLPFFFYFLYLR